EARLGASPLFATFIGDHRYDDRGDELSAEAEQRRRATWVELRDRAAALDGLDEADPVTRALLLHELDDALRAHGLSLGQMACDHADLLIPAGQVRAPEPEHARMAIERTRLYGTMLDQAADRFRAALAPGRTPARINIERSLNHDEGYLDSPIERDPFVNL